MPRELTSQERKTKEDQNDNRDDAKRYPGLTRKNMLTSTQIKKVTCPKCFRLFFNKKNVKRHMKTQHHETGRLQCPDCEKNFASKTAVEYHFQKCHSSKNQGIDCRTCGENFPDIATLRTHCRHQHKPVIRHNCDECPETFSSKSNRNRHLTEEHAIINFNVKRVTVDDLFSCDLCNFLSKRKYNMQQHKLKLHSNQSDSTSCDICSKTFKYRSNLRRHLSNSHQAQLIIADILNMLIHNLTD